MTKHTVENFLPKFRTSKSYTSTFQEINAIAPEGWSISKIEAAAGYLWYRRSMTSNLLYFTPEKVLKIRPSTLVKYERILSGK